MMFGNWKYGPEAREGRERRGRRYGYRRPKYNVPVNIIEHDTAFEVHVHAVTFPKEGIKVSVVEDMLYISGTRTPEGEDSPNFILQEYPIKSFERSFELSQKVDTAGITAKHENGILIVHVPKTRAAQRPEQVVEIE